MKLRRGRSRKVTKCSSGVMAAAVNPVDIAIRDGLSMEGAALLSFREYESPGESLLIMPNKL